jgi:transposase
MRHVRGDCRDQAALFPLSLDELIPPAHCVRVLDAFVDRLDLAELDFRHAIPRDTGRPPYDPADLLKLYLYGYLHQIRSSRRLERKCRRNVELMWLLHQLAPDFKTIADFRKDNGSAVVSVCREFVRFCRSVGLVAGELVAIDGSKFRSVASPRSVLYQGKLRHEIARLDAHIAEYMRALEESDSAASSERRDDEAAMRRALDVLAARRAKAQSAREVLVAKGVTHEVPGEPEARLMKTGDGMSEVCYNMQQAVDAKHGLIVHHELTTDANDTRQLWPVARATQAALDGKSFAVVADAGYSNGEQLEACEAAGIIPFVSTNRHVKARGEPDTYFGRDAFRFDPMANTYQCLGGHTLKQKKRDPRYRLRIYATSKCFSCPLKAQCTPGRQRLMSRHYEEAAFERAAQRNFGGGRVRKASP